MADLEYQVLVLTLADGSRRPFIGRLLPALPYVKELHAYVGTYQSQYAAAEVGMMLDALDEAARCAAEVPRG